MDQKLLHLSRSVLTVQKIVSNGQNHASLSTIWMYMNTWYFGGGFLRGRPMSTLKNRQMMPILGLLISQAPFPHVAGLSYYLTEKNCHFENVFAKQIR